MLNHRYATLSLSLLSLLCLLSLANVAQAATEDPFLGDWQSGQLVAQVIPRGSGRYQINLLPEFDTRCQPLAVVDAQESDGVLRFAQDGWSGQAQAGRITVSGTTDGQQREFVLQPVQRPSPRIGAEPPAGAVVLFDGSGFDHWQRHGGRGAEDQITWELCEDFMRVAPVDKQTLAGHSLVTKGAFQDFRLHLEFRLPLMADKTGQARANGGLAFEDANWYEVQVLDSYGLEGLDNECGGIYKVAAPAVNMCRPPLMWQTYDIQYHAPRYDEAGQRTRPGRISVTHNGKCIHDDVTLPDSPKALQRRQANPDGVSSGRIILHYHKNPIEYRNIWLQELDGEA
jgi:hypothetical protein